MRNATDARYAILNKNFDHEYAARGAYHHGSVGFERIFFDRNYRILSQNIRNSRMILDLGCGEGALSRYFRGDQSIFGLDKSFEALQLARQISIEKCAAGDFLAIPFADNSFDAVVSSMTLQYVGAERWPRLLAEIDRVLTPGGLLCFSYVNPKSAGMALSGGRLASATAAEVGLVPVLCLGQLTDVLKAHGYKIRRKIGTNLRVPYQRVPKWARQAVWTLACLLGAVLPDRSYHFVIVAQRDA